MSKTTPEYPDGIVRPAAVSDTSRVIALVDRLTAFGPPDHRDAKAMAAVDREIIAAAIHNTSEEQAVFVMEAEAGVAGVLHMTTLEDYYTRRSNAHVATLIIDAAFEGRGFGARLLARAEDWARARGDDWMTLTVFPQNTRAVSIYERNGFRADMARYLKPLVPATCGTA